MDSFAFYRILGNDLFLRRDPQQGLVNLQFILDYEPLLPNLEKRWIVNRIADPEIEAQIIDILRYHSQGFIRIEFNLDVYRALQPDYSHFTQHDFIDFMYSGAPREYARLLTYDHSLGRKNQYLTNVNSARNLALRNGRSCARWTLPWDGNCFLTEAAWRMILEQARQAQDIKYIIVPMERLLRNEDVLDPGFNPVALDEPQVIFRNDSTEEFDEELRYGRFSKVELLRRLGVSGVWDGWEYKPWENKQWTSSLEFGLWRRAGWVARLFSGEWAFEEDPAMDRIRERAHSRRIAIRQFIKNLDVQVLRRTLWGLKEDPAMDGIRKRTHARRIAIREFIKKLDIQVLKSTLRPDRLLLYDERLLHLAKETWRKTDCSTRRFADSVIADADRALLAPLDSVMQKSANPPSGDSHDYFSPAPFWWPNPLTPSGLPYIRRDGKRIPEAEHFSEESQKYDCTRLQKMFERVTVLALAWYFTESTRYAGRALEIVRTWFLRPETRMNPHLRYSQVKPGHKYGGYGIIEAKDFYYFLDAVRLLRRSPDYSSWDQSGILSWCQEYLSWLLTSEQGCSEACEKNNHGTCYDLQVMALCGFLGDYARFVDVSYRLKARLSSQFSSDGSQAHELGRTDPLHYCTFNLQSWFNLAVIAERAGVDLWNYPSRDGSALEKAFRWMTDHKKWTSLPSFSFDESRLAPLISIGVRKFGFDPGSFTPSGTADHPLCLHPYAGVPPYWPLAFGFPYSEHKSGPQERKYRSS